MEQSPETSEMLNANRNVIGSEDATHSASASMSSGSSTDASNRIAAPVVVASFDWKKWAPWIIGVLLLLIVVWLLSRKRSAPVVA